MELLLINNFDDTANNRTKWDTSYSVLALIFLFKQFNVTSLLISSYNDDHDNEI